MTKRTESARRGLYPPIVPYHSDMIDVGDGHRLYYEECGNPRGKPVVMLHGGPGGGCNDKMRRFHNPDAYRIVLFDQRGAGRSSPHASLDNNTTSHLVADIEVIRAALGIDKWQIFGGSWGSTLALAYAQTHPDRVTELVLRGIFMLRRKEIQWFYQHGASEIFPDRWQQFLAPIPKRERHDLVSAYHRRLTGEHMAERLTAARAWATWEGATSCLLPDPDLVADFGEESHALAMARIECHYFMNGGFLEEDQLLMNVGRIRNIPAVIVQGRYDVVCPMTSAWELHQAWPEAQLRVAADAGHSAFEPGNTHELVNATDEFS